MLKTYRDSGNIELLASYDFLDLCLLGETGTSKTHTAKLYATHRDLSVFREDIRYRVTHHAIYLRPLRERVDEIVPLAKGFLDNLNAKSGRRVQADRAVLNMLETAPWYGNISRATLFCRKDMRRYHFCCRENNRSQLRDSVDKRDRVAADNSHT